MKFLKLSILSFIALLATSSLAFSQTTATVEQVEVEEMKTITVKVKGVGCSNDVKSIALNVKKLTGVNTCEVGKNIARASLRAAGTPHDQSGFCKG